MLIHCSYRYRWWLGALLILLIVTINYEFKWRNDFQQIKSLNKKTAQLKLRCKAQAAKNNASKRTNELHMKFSITNTQTLFSNRIFPLFESQHADINALTSDNCSSSDHACRNYQITFKLQYQRTMRLLAAFALLDLSIDIIKLHCHIQSKENLLCTMHFRIWPWLIVSKNRVLHIDKQPFANPFCVNANALPNISYLNIQEVPLAQLTMVGSIIEPEGKFALMQLPNKETRLIHTGMIVGMEHAIVKDIFERRIILKSKTGGVTMIKVKA